MVTNTTTVTTTTRPRSRHKYFIYTASSKVGPCNGCLVRLGYAVRLLRGRPCLPVCDLGCHPQQLAITKPLTNRFRFLSPIRRLVTVPIWFLFSRKNTAVPNRAPTRFQPVAMLPILRITTLSVIYLLIIINFNYAVALQNLHSPRWKNAGKTVLFLSWGA